MRTPRVNPAPQCAAALAADRAAFDEATSQRKPLAARATHAISERLHVLLYPVRLAFPVLRLPWFDVVMANDDVQAVLSDDSVFATPFKDRMAELDRTGEVSLLGTRDEAAYQRSLCQVMRGLRLDDLPRLAAMAAELAERIMSGATNELDVVGQLLRPITLEIAQDYFGLAFKDPDEFHRWVMAISNYVFHDTPPDARLRRAATAAGRLIDAELDPAIQARRRAAPDTVLRRLADIEGPPGRLTHGQMRATIAGLLTGMLPNLPAAGYNVLEVLLRRRDAMEIARSAAIRGDDDLLQRCILEALRFQPLTPGVRRRCVAEHGAEVGPGRHRRRIPHNRQVMASTLSAMFDARAVRRPFRFDPFRPPSDNIAFGSGKHWCVGAPMALVILTQALKPLLRRPSLSRVAEAPPTSYFLGFFPENLTLTFGEVAT